MVYAKIYYLKDKTFTVLWVYSQNDAFTHIMSRAIQSIAVVKIRTQNFFR